MTSFKAIFAAALLACCLCGTLSASPFTIAYLETDGTRFHLDVEFLPHPDSYAVFSGPSLTYCEQPGTSCSQVGLLPRAFTEGLGHFDQVWFPDLSTANFPDMALSQLGASLTLPGSPLDARVVVYERRPDYVYEYFFKDSTGQRSFRYLTPRLLMDDSDVPIDDLDTCASTPGTTCEAPQFNFDVQEFDALAFTESGFSFAYLFPRLAFSELGIHETAPGGLFSGTLRVSYIRLERESTPPGGDPEAPVPEPSAALFVLSGIAMLGLAENRRRRVTQS